LVGHLFQFLARSLVHFASNHFPIMALPSNAVNEELTADVTITIESKLSRVGSLNKYFMMIVIQHCDIQLFVDRKTIVNILIVANIFEFM
jgi:hypothetical protein